MSQGHPVTAGSAVILIDPMGRVLLWRDDGSESWGIPRGEAEPGEELRATALRVFREATGAELTRLRFFRAFARDDIAGLDRRGLSVFFADDDVPLSAMSPADVRGLAYWMPAEVLALPLAPEDRVVLERFFPDDLYRGTVAMKAAFRVGVTVIELDRWGRVLLQLRDADLPPERFPDHWSLPGGLLEAGESPDAGALREFEEETGNILEELKLFRVYRRDIDLPGALVDIQHVYYFDADIDEDLIVVGEGQAFRYFAPGDIGSLQMPPATARILGDFFASTHYRAMFH